MASQPATPAPASLADTKWDALFGDDTLNQLIRTALDRNFDVRIAAERVQQARAQLGITRADQFPFVDVQAQFSSVASVLVGFDSFRSRRHQSQRELYATGRRSFLGSRLVGAPSTPDRGGARPVSRE